MGGIVKKPVRPKPGSGRVGIEPPDLLRGKPTEPTRPGSPRRPRRPGVPPRYGINPPRKPGRG